MGQLLCQEFKLDKAKIIKYRFKEEIMEILDKINFEKLGKSDIRANLDELYSTLTLDNIDNIVKDLKFEKKQ